MIIAGIVFLPCFLIVNDSGNFLPNLLGFLYALILYISKDTKVAKKAINHVIQANKDIDLWMSK